MPIIDFYARSESDVVTFSKTQINFSASLVEKIKLLDCDFARIGVDPELRRIYFAFQKDAGPGLQKLFRQLAGARPPQYSSPQHDVPTMPLTHNGEFPYTPGHLKQVLITSPSEHFFLAFSADRTYPLIRIEVRTLVFMYLARLMSRSAGEFR